MITQMRKRFILIATASAALVVVLLSLIVNVANFISTDSELTDMLDIIHDNRGSIPQAYQENDDRHGGKQNDKPRHRDDGHGKSFSQETPYSTRYFVLIYTDSGGLLQVNLEHIASVTEENVQSFLELAMKHGEGYGYTTNYKYYIQRLDNGRYVAIFLNCYQEMRFIRLLLLFSLLADAICVALVFALVVLLSRRAIDPLVRSVQRQKQFITDASHELKTPLTVITTSLKVLEMEVGPQKWIDKAQRQTVKMTNLVNALVTLSRMDEDEPPLTLVDFNISAAVSEIAETFRETFFTKGYSLELDVEPDVIYHGDEASIRQFVSILMDNAVKYASGDGPVKLTLQKTYRGIILHAANPCEPISDSDLEKIFDRFYRVDTSRSSGAGSFGVGLSIARSIAEAHHGVLYAKCPTPKIIDFTAVLK